MMAVKPQDEADQISFIHPGALKMYPCGGLVLFSKAGIGRHSENSEPDAYDTRPWPETLF